MTPEEDPSCATVVPATRRIAITLLAIELRLPAGVHLESFDESLPLLVRKALGFGLSFGAVGTYWWVHNRLFQRVRAIDGTLLVLNLVHLLCVATLPFSTGLLGEALSPLRVAIYGGLTALTALTQLLMWLHAARRPQLVGALDPVVRRTITLRLVCPPVAFTLCALLAPVSPPAALAAWAAGPVGVVLAGWWAQRPTAIAPVGEAS